MNNVQKIIIAIVCLFLFTGGFFVAKVPFDEKLLGISSFNILFFALPSYFSVCKWLGLKKGLLLIILLGIFAFTIETIAIKTGFPYGSFFYSNKIGYKLFDTTPWTVPFAWTPLLFGVTYITSRFTRKNLPFVLTCTLLLLGIDLVIDPAAVHLNFWTYNQMGSYYGVPISNFMGWIFSGIIGALIFYLMTYKQLAHIPKNMTLSLLLILIFWSSVCLWSGLYIPAIIGLIFSGYLLKIQI